MRKNLRAGTITIFKSKIGVSHQYLLSSQLVSYGMHFKKSTCATRSQRIPLTGENFEELTISTQGLITSRNASSYTDRAYEGFLFVNFMCAQHRTVENPPTVLRRAMAGIIEQAF